MSKIIYSLAILFLFITPNYIFAQELDEMTSDNIEITDINSENISDTENTNISKDSQYTEPDGFYRAQVQAVGSCSMPAWQPLALHTLLH